MAEAKKYTETTPGAGNPPCSDRTVEIAETLEESADYGGIRHSHELEYISDIVFRLSKWIQIHNIQECLWKKM